MVEVSYYSVNFNDKVLYIIVIDGVKCVHYDDFCVKLKITQNVGTCKYMPNQQSKKIRRALKEKDYSPAKVKGPMFVIRRLEDVIAYHKEKYPILIDLEKKMNAATTAVPPTIKKVSFGGAGMKKYTKRSEVERLADDGKKKNNNNNNNKKRDREEEDNNNKNIDRDGDIAQIILDQALPVIKKQMRDMLDDMLLEIRDMFDDKYREDVTKEFERDVIARTKAAVNKEWEEKVATLLENKKK